MPVRHAAAEVIGQTRCKALLHRPQFQSRGPALTSASTSASTRASATPAAGTTNFIHALVVSVIDIALKTQLSSVRMQIGGNTGAQTCPDRSRHGILATGSRHCPQRWQQGRSLSARSCLIR